MEGSQAPVENRAPITPAQEKDKYERIWKCWQYRQSSPGERLVPFFLDHADWKPGQTLIDVGCGTGRASVKLASKGFKVSLLDITKNALDTQTLVDLFGVEFHELCLWETLVVEPYDWFYCCDVMEHIPPEHIDDALDSLKDIAKKGFLNIAMFDEPYGDLIGEKLHLTVRGYPWWMDRLKERWKVKELGEVEYQRLCAIVE